MGLNPKVFKTRALSAVIFAVIIVAAILAPLTGFLIIFSIVHVGCWIEYLKLVEKITFSKYDSFIKYYCAISGLIMMLVFGLQNNSSDVGIAGPDLKIIAWIILMLGLIFLILKSKKLSSRAKMLGLGGFFYISLSFTLLLHLRTQSGTEDYEYIEFGKLVVCSIIFSIWINDTMAYIVGSFIGKTPFSKISPKKTWEGTIGGALLCVIVIALLAQLNIASGVKMIHWIVIASICAVFGTIGDLFESKLKRLAAVKDSGTIMPGHGGFLDRFDSLLIAVPFVWLYIQLFLEF